MNDGHSEQDLELLTEEERAGLESEGDEGAAAGDIGDGVDGAGDDDKGDDGEDGQGGDDAGGGDGKEGQVADAGAGSAAVDEGGEGRDDGADDANGDDEDDYTAPVAPLGERVDVEEAKGKLSDIETRMSELDEKLDEGELTTKEYREQLTRLSDEKNGIANQIQRQEDHDRQVTQGWYADVGRFLEKNPDLTANDTRLQSFDSVVRRVTGDPANDGLSNHRKLALARDLWREEMGFAQAVPDKGKGKTEADPKPKPKPRVEIPPTLAHVPAADISDADDGKYSHLDSLLNAGKHIEYEEALGRLSESEQQDYLSRP